MADLKSGGVKSFRILGIDPGLRHTGFAVIEKSGNELKYIYADRLSPKEDLPLGARLNVLFEGMMEVLYEFEPSAVALEETFVNTNAKTTLRLGQARGVVLLAPYRLGIEVYEYAPNKIKKAITGQGHADKEMIKKMLDMLLPKKPDDLSPDALDALAIALAHERYLGNNPNIDNTGILSPNKIKSPLGELEKREFEKQKLKSTPSKLQNKINQAIKNGG